MKETNPKKKWNSLPALWKTLGKEVNSSKNHSVLNEQIENDHDLIVKIDVEGHEEVVINELCKIDKTNNIKNM